MKKKLQEYLEKELKEAKTERNNLKYKLRRKIEEARKIAALIAHIK